MEDENNKHAISCNTASNLDPSSPERAPRRDSESMFTESPVYDIDTQELSKAAEEHGSLRDAEPLDDENSTDVEDAVIKKELPSSELTDNLKKESPKIQKIESESINTINTQDLDAEVTGFNITPRKRKFPEWADEGPSSSKTTTPLRSSPRKIVKRSNSCTCHDNVTMRPRTPRARAASVDLSGHGDAATPKKGTTKFEQPVTSPASNCQPSVPFGTIQEETIIDPNDSQNFHLQLSPSPPDEEPKESKHEEVNIPATGAHSSNTFTSDPTRAPQNLEHNSSEQSNEHSQSLLVGYHKSRLSAERTTDQDSTDSVGSIMLDSPGPPSTVTSKLITKLSNGDSSTPTEAIAPKHTITISDNEESTPDSNKNNVAQKRFAVKNESFRISNSTTPSTISPFQNGHTFPLHTPSNPSFDIHISHDDDGEFLSMYVVRTDNDLGLDMCKEFQRVSKRFTMDPYLADASKSSSPSSVTSGGLLPIPLPILPRSSFASTVSSSTSSSSAGNRTSDGAFIVPQPPGRALSHQGTTSVRGYKALLKKIHEIFSHMPDAPEDANRSDDKVSVDVQVSPGLAGEKHSNGSASPEEISRCDRATPKSSLKKTKVKGRRPLSAKTKRAILPTQAEEPEYMHGMNSPEMIPSGAERDANDKAKVAPGGGAVGTPKSVSKVKERRRARAESPRPATPLELPLQPSGHAPGTPVLAKWVDKRYYSGKVVEMLDPGKYQIEFDDGHTKTLLEEFIIFGSANELPLEGQSVYAMVDDEQTYEPGLVLAVEHNSRDTVTYRCTTDGEATVSVTASELYMTEDQARLLKESVAPHSPAAAPSTPATPRRRLHRELDLDNIIQGPRSARARDRGSARKRLASPKSPKASTSGIKGRVATPLTGRKQRQVSESSEVSEGSGSGAPPAAAADGEVPGVEPELQRTPRKIDGIKAGPLQLKGAARQTTGKKNSKLSKFENDATTVAQLGPIPQRGSRLFGGLHFLLTCSPARQPPRPRALAPEQRVSSEDTGDTNVDSGSDYEGREFTRQPFHKERLREQLEAGGGTVHAHLDDVPTLQYTNTRLIANRACYTAKYIQCLAADVRPLCHSWVIESCAQQRLRDEDSFALPAGWSHRRNAFVTWTGSAGRRGGSVFKEKLVLLCGEERFVKFWERVCSLAGAGAHTRVVCEESAELAGALAVLTDPDCPHELQNKADQEGVPLVSPTWLVQCLIEGRVCPPAAHPSYSFMYIT